MHKFRVWCKNKNEWEKDLCWLTQNGTLIHSAKEGHWIPLKPETHIVQFSTGLHDRNGWEIYHYDILQNSMGRRWVVDWRCDEKYCGWDLRIINGDMPHCIGETFKDFKIIGNVFQNKELLNDSQHSETDSDN